LKLQEKGTPWVIAKWAMTLDGALATANGDSKWISNEFSRRIVHRLRARVDAVIVGIGTVLADDPMLDARLGVEGQPSRICKRVVLDRHGRIPMQSKLVQTARHSPVLVAMSAQAAKDRKAESLMNSGCEVIVIPDEFLERSIEYVLRELGLRRHTNVLIEGGSEILGSAFDAKLVDEVHCFVAPKLAGGSKALRPVVGRGCALMSDALQLVRVETQTLSNDTYIHGFTQLQ
jgi:diaminohydroxyphosphoribosylaminopyrimidine deaminase / 5-amino-6-(5-phosphoribosylamino)uracil reductase